MGLKDSIRKFLARVGGSPADPRSSGDGGPPGGESSAGEEHQPALEKKLGHFFADRSLLAKALHHRSHIHVTGQDREDSNERLEFLGDAVLGLVVNETLYERFPDRSEGDLTQMKSLLVCGARLCEVAKTIDLGVHIRMSRSEAATGGRKRSSILADTMEALIGAIYLDAGLPAARLMIQTVVLVGSENVLAKRSLRNYKSRLQETIQARYKTPPRYKILGVEGPDHDRVFQVAVMFGGTVLGVGSGGNKKSAEQGAAREALAILDQDPDFLEG